MRAERTVQFWQEGREVVRAGVGIRSMIHRFLLRNTLLAVAVVVAISGLSGNVSAQSVVLADSTNGLTIPARGDYRVFLVFAEVDWSSCGQGNDTNGGWQQGQLPPFRDQMFDHTLSATPTGLFTDYYYQMSMGRYRVLGDYYPHLITLSCSPFPSSVGVIAAVQARHETGGPNAGQALVTANLDPTTGLPYDLDDFDLWTPTLNYQQKLQAPDNRVDMVLVVWRNYCEHLRRQCANFSAGSIGGGYFGTLGATSSGPTKAGVNVMGNFVGAGLSGLVGILTHEFNHPLLGGNNWHIGAGADRHTVPFQNSAYGLFGNISPVVSAWGRNQLGWRESDLTPPISASAADGSRVPSDISIESHPNGVDFTLRDFMTTGDAIRIKLPHIDWQMLGDIKNQYLWLENRQMLPRRFDGTSFAADRLFDTNIPLATATCFEKWQKGMHAYIQIGKEKGFDIDGDGDIDEADINSRASNYPTGHEHPNALGSYLFPLTAEGNFDFYYQLDRVLDQTTPGRACQWDNVAIPINKALSLANPFTGHSDVFRRADSDAFLTLPPATFIPFGNGILFDGDLPKFVFADFVGGNVVLNLPEWGDSQDSFNMASGKTKMSIGTNPAPVPVYTLAYDGGGTGAGSANLAFNPAAPESFENRTIWLNGLSVEILAEYFVDVDNSSLVVRVRWDDYRVGNDVRWTGNIVLQNDAKDPRARQSRITVARGKNIYLDRGLSPTQHVANVGAKTVEFPTATLLYPPGLLAETGELFTSPTELVIRAGTKVHLERAARIWLHNGSTLTIEAGAEVQLEPGAEIRQGPGGGTVNNLGTIRDFGDLNGDGCVDRADLMMLTMEIHRPGTANLFHDLNEDNRVNILDARRLVTFFTNAGGGTCN